MAVLQRTKPLADGLYTGFISSVKESSVEIDPTDPLFAGANPDDREYWVVVDSADNRPEFGPLKPPFPPPAYSPAKPDWLIVPAPVNTRVLIEFVAHQITLHVREGSFVDLCT